MTPRLTALAPLVAGLWLLTGSEAALFAQDAATEPAFETVAWAGLEETVTPADAANAPIINEAAFAIDNFFIFVCAALVLFMQAGFALLEAGLNSSQNTVNILFRNLLGMCVGVLAFLVCGYQLMYPSGSPLIEGYLGSITPGISGTVVSSENPSGSAGDATAEALTDEVHFFFQVALAVTAAAIVSGAVAGRMKFGAYVVSTAVMCAAVYPIIGYWKSGDGWLHQLGMYDFAGSGVVHMAGGFAGLAGAIVLGPRIGRYNADGKPMSMPGHSLPLATLGVFVLMIGWFGLNGGSQLRVYGADNTHAVAFIAVNTLLAACAGGIVSTFLSWMLFSKPDLSMAMNGILGALVGVSASCNGVTNLSAVVIGTVAGAIVVGAIILLDKLRIDDPVGAFPVHGVCGMWGLIACAIFGSRAYWGGPAEGVAFGNWTAQITGLCAIAAFSFTMMGTLFSSLKAIGFLRVLPEKEEKGLDVSEHGMSAYAA